MDANISWFNFFTIIAIIATTYVFLLVILKFVPHIFKRKSVINKITLVLNKTIEIYKPIAILLIILSFVAVNYKIHGILTILFLIISFSHIKRYLYGVLFKINPLVNIGSNILTGDFKGDIYKFLFFGVIINEETGNRFVSYSYIDENGFSIHPNDNLSIQQTIYIHEQENTSQILDILFENPNIDFNNKPIIKNIPDKKMLQIQIALENGAKIESLITYLNQKKIKTSLTKN